ncbi:hypothetical protein GQ44DRAFT_749344 [Phaeosphaeriaceae sp. PMI808]|nr:hypothetical protein GQ44DRAFT_749344 [Phaeosphaeriaceae sp. PMI808]
MATAGLDKLVDFLLSEIALCGTQVWEWVVTHSDIRVVHGGKVCSYGLVEFEEVGNELAVVGVTKPADSLLSLRDELRQRLSAEGRDANTSRLLSTLSGFEGVEKTGITGDASKFPGNSQEGVAVFDEPSSTITAPRLFASQNRIWQALTGHSMDLKKVPTMEFQLLSLIASRGEEGITQPELTHLSGQDKRSVPHRTGELARKGYIAKNPVQAGKARTSLCVHIKFITQTHFTSSGVVEDVFREGTFVASSFVHLLYNTLRDAGVVPTREIRQRLGVPMRTWNKRAVQGTLIRLDQTGMINRFRVRKKKLEDSWVTCIQVQREPRPEDLENLGFRRQTTAHDANDDPLQEDGEGDTLMRDLEADMLEDGDDDKVDNPPDVEVRIPPQWTPDRLLVNIIFHLTKLGGANGLDGTFMRDRVVGPFWRRPMEAHLIRLTDDWERMQPTHLRHLAIVRDTRNTEEKKFLHYVYRTYEHFQQAVSAGEAAWEGVRKPGANSHKPVNQGKSAKDSFNSDSWGFLPPNEKNFLRFNGTATLLDVRSAIVGPRKYGRRWDIAIAEEIGYQRLETSLQKMKAKQATKDSPRKPKAIKEKKKRGTGLTLTQEQRVALGLKSTGRLSKDVAKQILAHRRQTGDSSLPDRIVSKSARDIRVPLMTKEERLAENLPLTGRLGVAKENEIREKRGLPKLPEKNKKKRSTKNEAPVLSKQQRAALGFKNNGRLHQHFIDALRQEQEDGVPLEDSPAVEAYREFLKAEAEKVAARKDKGTASNLEDSIEDHISRSTSVVEDEHILDPSLQVEIEVQPPPHEIGTGKRKEDGAGVAPPTPKRRRTRSILSQENGDPTSSPRPNSSRGLRTYPFAKRKYSRGRPRNAYIAVFKSARLRGLPWFVSESSGRPVGVAPDSRAIPATELEQQEATDTQADIEMCEDEQSGAMDIVVNENEVQEEQVVDPARRVVKGSMLINVTEEHEEGPQAPVESTQQPVEDVLMCTDVETHQGGSTVPALRHFPTLLATTQEPNPRPVAGWRVTNAAAQGAKPQYQSPYAPGAQPYFPPIQEADTATVASPSSSQSNTPAPETNDPSSLPEGVVGVIAERIHTVAPRKIRARGAVPGIIGSALKFRREIIMEIIEICGGVFPLHGEIWRPFSAMWDRKHGHTSMPKPGSSTVTDTLRNMIGDPAYDLKRMAFLVKAQNATGAKERVIVTKRDIAPNDPKVVRLAYNMANHALDKSHQYYPVAIRGLFEFETLYVPAPVAPKIDTVSLDQLYPEIENSIKENRDRRRREKAAQKKLAKEAAKKQNEQVETAAPKSRVLAPSAPHAKRSRLASLNDRNKTYRRAPVLAPVLEHVEEPSRDVGHQPSPADSSSSGDVPLMSLRSGVGEIVGRGADDEEISPSDLDEGDNDNEAPGDTDTADPDLTSVEPTKVLKTTKRVRIDDSVSERPGKKARRSSAQEETLDDEFVHNSAEESDVTSSEEEEEIIHPKEKRRRKRTASKRQIGKVLPEPTFLEQLTGLTGDPSDPIYKDPKQRYRPGHVSKTWGTRKPKQPKIRKDGEILDHIDNFKKVCFTLALAYLMSADGEIPNWGILEKVYIGDKSFDLPMVQRLWSWMQTHITKHLAAIIDTLQSNILTAYEAGRLPMIHDPEVYDWAGLLPLPSLRESLKQVNWYGQRLADTTRTQLQLQLPFVAPLHRTSTQDHSAKDKELKARSWPFYDANKAHDKLKTLGEDVLTKVDFLKMRKLKRQLPGRNYAFTRKSARGYKSSVKKDLDFAFASEDPTKRFYSISRCEEDGSVMALMSLVGEGKVKLLPRLPPVNNEFGAPLPRLSSWGFCEGDYIHRSIDRNRLFWDIHVVPTSSYEFGNPLYWPALPEPPLPGKNDMDALLPIWSSINGQKVTWPWWNRVLNLVLQPLFVQPGATATDVYHHCSKNTVELFEVELVLGWLDSIGAVSKTVGSGYQTTPSFWAAFGDKLLAMEDDWFGEHVKRKIRRTTKHQWRDKFNLQYSTMHAGGTQNVGVDTGPPNNQAHGAVSEQIGRNSKAQYRIVQQALSESALQSAKEIVQAEDPLHALDETGQNHASTSPELEGAVKTSYTPGGANSPDQDTEMADAGLQTLTDEEDVDAEGEIDEAW